MQSIKIETTEKSHVLILTEKEMSDIKSGLYVAMKRLDKSKDPEGSDRRLSNRLEVIYESLFNK